MINIFCTTTDCPESLSGEHDKFSILKFGTFGTLKIVWRHMAIMFRGRLLKLLNRAKC